MTSRGLSLFLMLAGAALYLVSPALARESLRAGMIEGPVMAEVVSVVDGDTILVNARPWPQNTISVLVRLRGIDAPERRSRCRQIRQAAARARVALENLAYGDGGQIVLANISGDKYFGRVVADVFVGEGVDLAARMLSEGLVRPYDGGHKPKQICQSL